MPSVSKGSFLHGHMEVCEIRVFRGLQRVIGFGDLGIIFFVFRDCGKHNIFEQLGPYGGCMVTVFKVQGFRKKNK